jgi:hypothetical protein
MISADEARELADKVTPLYVALSEIDRQIACAANMGRKMVAIDYPKVPRTLQGKIIEALESVGFVIDFGTRGLNISW